MKWTWRVFWCVLIAAIVLGMSVLAARVYDNVEMDQTVRVIIVSVLVIPLGWAGGALAAYIAILGNPLDMFK